jgi:hypothetical protein
MKEKTGRDRILQLFDDLDTSKLLATTKYRTACNQCSNTQAEAIAARDKEWVEKEKNLVSFISLIIKREGCIDALECEHNEGCVENVLHGKCNKAQELKKEVSNGK